MNESRPFAEMGDPYGPKPWGDDSNIKSQPAINSLKCPDSPQVFAEAMNIVVDSLVNALSPWVGNFLREIWNSSIQTPTPYETLRTLLQAVKTWNHHHIHEITAKIEGTQNTDVEDGVLQDAINAACISRAMVLMSIRIDPNAQPNVNIRLPSAPDFIHRVYIEVAAHVHDFAERYFPTTQVTLASDDIERIVKIGIQKAMTACIPIRSILKATMSPLSYKRIDQPAPPPLPTQPPPPPVVEPSITRTEPMQPPNLQPIPQQPQPMQPQPQQPMQPMQTEPTNPEPQQGPTSRLDAEPDFDLQFDENDEENDMS